jgi:hypothetical protein
VCVGDSESKCLCIFFKYVVRNATGCSKIRWMCAGKIIRVTIFTRTWTASLWRWSEQIIFHVPVRGRCTRH